MAEPPAGSAPAWVELEDVDSTNAEAMRRALSGERRPLYVRASRQSAGRGRSGRSWTTADGNLALSRLVPLGCPPPQVPQLSLVAGVALHRAVRSLLDAGGHDTAVALKWPNDLVAGRAKLAGILIEATSIGADRFAVIGIGLNIAAAPALADRETVSLAALGFAQANEPATPSRVARAVADQLEAALRDWDDGRGFAATRLAWLECGLPIGTEMSVDSGAGGRVTGTFAGLDEDGFLLIDLGGGGRMIVTVGDVALLSD